MRCGLSLLSSLVLVLLAGSWLACTRESGGPAGATSSPPRGPLMVEELRREPQRFQGEIRVLGVVGAVREGEALFALVDKDEVLACGGVDCAGFLLPVSWEGPMPKRGDTVVVTGALEKSAGGFVFAAKRVEGQ